MVLALTLVTVQQNHETRAEIEAQSNWRQGVVTWENQASQRETTMNQTLGALGGTMADLSSAVRASSNRPIKIMERKAPQRDDLKQRALLLATQVLAFDALTQQSEPQIPFSTKLLRTEADREAFAQQWGEFNELDRKHSEAASAEYTARFGPQVFNILDEFKRRGIKTALDHYCKPAVMNSIARRLCAEGIAAFAQRLPDK